MEAGCNATFGTSESPVRLTVWSDDFVFENPTQRLVAASVICLVTVIGIPGNSLVILAAMLSKKLQNKTNIFVVNLACADMLTCVVLPFQAFSLLNQTWPLSHTLCETIAILVCVGPGTSVFTLALIAFIRYSIITNSRTFNARLFTKTNLSLLVCGTWLLPLFFTLLPPAFDVGAVGYSQRYKICLSDSVHPLSEIYAVVSLLVFLPCLVVIVLCYVKIYLFVRTSVLNLIQFGNPSAITKGPKSSQSGPLTSTEVAIFRRQVKVTKNLFIVVCTFIICVMPLGLTNLIILIAPIYPLKLWTILLLFMNTCMNPIIYGLKHPQFKEVFWPIMTCSWRNIPEPSSLVLIFRREGVFG